jgi:hypothetical protein
MPTPLSASLDRDLLRAHAAGDRRALSRLYLSGAENSLADGAEGAAAFFFTQAYVFALDAGDDEVARVAHARLVSLGCES